MNPTIHVMKPNYTHLSTVGQYGVFCKLMNCKFSMWSVPPIDEWKQLLEAEAWLISASYDCNNIDVDRTACSDETCF